MAELIAAGAQLIYNVQGQYATKEQMSALARWAQTTTQDLVRRKIV